MLSIIDLFFPKKSLPGEEGYWISSAERRQLRSTPLRLSKDLLIKRGNAGLDQLVASGSYHDNPLLKRAIKAFKYGRIKALGDDLAVLMADAGRELLTHNHEPVLCPVPLHWSRTFSRGFNQCDELALRLSGLLGYPMAVLLTRRRATGFQARRGRTDRLQAMQFAFEYIGPDPAPPEVILIDDLATTGTTISACARELKLHGVKRVSALVIAQG